MNEQLYENQEETDEHGNMVAMVLKDASLEKDKGRGVTQCTILM